MPLPDGYLTYPHRVYGGDQPRYPWRPADKRPAIAWPGGKALACLIVVPLEHHMLNPSGKPFKHPGAVVTPYPDLRHYTTRDYGNRVGVFRLLDALKAAGLTATFPINALLAERLPVLVEAIQADGHEIAAYGLDTDHIHWGGLDPAVEADWIAQVQTKFAARGLRPTTWMSPARQQSFDTLDLIAKAGFTACMDWEPDEAPIALTTAGGPLAAVPLMNELDDRLLLIDRRQSETEWADQIIEAKSRLIEARPSGAVLSFTLTPYITGLPFRIAAVRRVLGDLASDGQVWSATAGRIATFAG